MEYFKLDYNIAKATIAELESLNLKTAPCSYIKELLNRIIFISYPFIKLNKGDRIIRSRLIKSVQDIPTRQAPFSYPKRKRFYSDNRCNTTEKSNFYGTVETENLKSYETSILEIIPKILPDICVMETITGVWELQRDMTFIIIGENSKDSVGSNQLTRRKHEMIEPLKKEDRALEIIDAFLTKEFTKKVDDDKRYEYKISACFTELLEGFAGIKGLIYPSCQTNCLGSNIVIFSKHVRNKNVKFIFGAYVKFYHRALNFINEFKLKGSFQNGKVRWVEIFDGLHPKLKQYYIGKSADNSFLESIEMRDLNESKTA